MTNLIGDVDDMKILSELAPWAIERAGSSPYEYLNNLENRGFKIYHINEQDGRLNPIDVAHAGEITKVINLLCELHREVLEETKQIDEIKRN